MGDRKHGGRVSADAIEASRRNARGARKVTIIESRPTSHLFAESAARARCTIRVFLNKDSKSLQGGVALTCRPSLWVALTIEAGKLVWDLVPI